MKINTIVIVLAIVVIIGASLVGIFKTGNATKEDIFEGKITNLELEPMILEGVGVYDRSCNPVENGLSQCDAGIQTEKGLLNFNYKHEMHSQPCIDNGDQLKVEIFADGTAKVIRN